MDIPCAPPAENTVASQSVFAVSARASKRLFHSEVDRSDMKFIYVWSYLTVEKR